jgi:phosphohistidine phosphatase SixA
MACQSAEAPAGKETSPESISSFAATYYLVRHAEKELTGPDPALTPQGYARAAALAERLKAVPLAAVYSTDTRRTRETAADVLSQKNIPLVIYDGRDLGALARDLLSKDGEFLVVGHSNTTGELASALGGDGGSPIVEASEYDRLYVVARRRGADNGAVITTDLQRYPH